MTATRSTRNSARHAWAMVRDYAILIVLAAAFLLPIYYLIIGSFKPSSEVLTGWAGFLLVGLTLDNYESVFSSLSSDSTGYFVGFMANSVVISLTIVVLGLLVNSMAAYAFANLRWRGRDKVFLLIVVLVIVPFEAVAIPLVFMLNDQRNTLLIQILPFIANAFSIYLFYTFFLSFPKSVLEAARMDGLGPFGAFFRIVVPNSRPVFATVAILTFLAAWGQFLWPSLVISDPGLRTLPLEISVFSGQRPTDWGAVFAFGTLLVLPVLIFFVIFQRYFVQSVAGSAVKG